MSRYSRATHRGLLYVVGDLQNAVQSARVALNTDELTKEQKKEHRTFIADCEAAIEWTRAQRAKRGARFDQLPGGANGHQDHHHVHG